MKGYWIVLGSDVTDPDAQQAYGKLWAPIAENDDWTAFHGKIAAIEAARLGWGFQSLPH